LCLICVAGQTPQRRDFTYPRFLASTSPHERIVERFRQERSNQSDDSDSDAVEESAEFAELSRTSSKSVTSVAPAAMSVARSASMSDLSADSTAVPLQRAASVEASLNAAMSAAAIKDNKENFALPHPIPAKKGSGMKQPAVSTRKVLQNAQNLKTQ